MNTRERAGIAGSKDKSREMETGMGGRKVTDEGEEKKR